MTAPPAHTTPHPSRPELAAARQAQPCLGSGTCRHTPERRPDDRADQATRTRHPDPRHPLTTTILSTADPESRHYESGDLVFDQSVRRLVGSSRESNNDV